MIRTLCDKGLLSPVQANVGDSDWIVRAVLGACCVPRHRREDTGRAM